jgi:hypothetical protein
MKTSETKKFVQIFCEAFFILKKYFAWPSMTYFHFYKKGFLNYQAVRIRVEYLKFLCLCLCTPLNLEAYNILKAYWSF